MDRNEAAPGGGRSKQFPVADEEDDGCGDLYMDIHLSDEFLQWRRKNQDLLEQRNEDVKENKASLIPVESTSIALQRQGASSSRVPAGRADKNQNIELIGNYTSDVDDNTGFGREVGAQVGRSRLGVSNQEMLQHQQPHAANRPSPGNVANSSGNVYGGDTRGEQFDRSTATRGMEDDCGDLYKDIHYSEEFLQWRKNEENKERPVSGGGTILFVGELHWWTTDAQLESELCKYGPVKNVHFFTNTYSGKSLGYCQVELYDTAAATACKKGMNGHIFNGRPCVVEHAKPSIVKRMGDAQVNRNRQQMRPQAHVSQPRRRRGDNTDTGRGGGRGNQGRRISRGGMRNKVPTGPSMRSRAGGTGIRGLTGDDSKFEQGIGLHSQTMTGQGFDPSHGGFPGASTASFSGMLPTYGPVGNFGFPGVAPHFDPLFFWSGMPWNVMGVEGPNMGNWLNPNMGGWAAEQHGGKAGEGSPSRELNAVKENDKGSERFFSGSSSRRRHQGDIDAGDERDLHKGKDVARDHGSSGRRHHDDRDVRRDRGKDHDSDHECSLDRHCDRGDRGREGRDRNADRRKKGRGRICDTVNKETF